LVRKDQRNLFLWWQLYSYKRYGHPTTAMDGIDAEGRPAPEGRASKHNGKSSGGGFGAEDALEARARELDADKLFALRSGIMNVDDPAVGSEV